MLRFVKREYKSHHLDLSSVKVCTFTITLAVEMTVRNGSTHCRSVWTAFRAYRLGIEPHTQGYIVP